MTREEAIDILDDNFTVIDTHGHYTDEEVEQARQMAIEALEQAPILDKIRAEINNYGSIWVRYKIIGHTDQDIKNIVENVLKQAKEQVLDIIDKYKAESEGE